MKTVACIAGSYCSLPLIAFAPGVLAPGHVIGARNVFTILHHAAFAFASGLLVALSLGGVVFVPGSPGLPRTSGEAVFLGPTVVAFRLHGAPIRDDVLPQQRPAPDPDGAS